MIKLGVLPMPATTMCTPKDIEYRIKASDAAIVITDVENASKVDQVAGQCPSLKCLMTTRGSRTGWLSYDEEMAEASPYLGDVEPTRSDDPLMVYFTSGTVGYPKMVLHTQASYGLAHVITAKFWHDLRSTDMQWTISDTGWAKTAYGKLFGQWTQGATVIQHDAKGRFDPKVTLNILGKFGVTSFCAPPTVYRLLVLEDLQKYDLSGLRHCTSAGEPLNPGGHEAVAGRHRPHHLRRLRPDRVSPSRRQLPVHARNPRLDGQADARLPDFHSQRRRCRASAWR